MLRWGRLIGAVVVLGLGCMRPDDLPPARHAVGGTVTGLAGTGLVLRSGGTDLPVAANGPFTFPDGIAEGAPWLVTVAAQPTAPAQTCTVTGGAGTMGTSEVQTIQVTCTTDPPPLPSHAVGGSVAGLVGTGLVLWSGGADLPVAADGPFTFPDPVTEGMPWLVTVTAQPASPAQTCTVAGGWGTMGGADVTWVQVTCRARRLFLAGYEAVHGKELWSSDGTPAGTGLAVELEPGFNGSDVRGLTAFRGALYFTAYAYEAGTTWTSPLWRSDGTTGGTALVKDLAVRLFGVTDHVEQPSAGWFVPLGEALNFAATDHVMDYEVWRTDGTPEGTRRVADINAGDGGSSPWGFVELGGSLLFCADDGVHGMEPWRTDGTAAGTRLVMDVNPGAAGGCVPELKLTAFGGAVYVLGNDGIHGNELWRTDGTSAGTRLVKDVNPGASDAYVGGDAFAPGAMGGALYFQADDGVHGEEFWRTDGTEAGTVLVTDLLAGASGSRPHDFVAMGGALYFMASDGLPALWRTDGTATGTVKLGVTYDGGSRTGLVAGGGALWLRMSGPTGGGVLWTSDGTPAGTVPVPDPDPGSTGGDLWGITWFDGALYYAHTRPGPVWRLMRTDGTAGGTEVLAEIIAEGLVGF